VLLSQQAPTPYDLRFRLFGTPIRVHPFFWLFAAVIGWSHAYEGLIFLVIWVACVFVSILLHEFGHVLVGRLFGVRSHIVLQGMCGLAIPDHQPYSRWKRIAISLGGPGIQLAFWGLLELGLLGVPRTAIVELSEYFWSAISDLLWINLIWPLFNLLPIWPLDGGQVSRELFTWRARYNGLRYSLVLSIAFAAVIAVHSALVAMKAPIFIHWLPFGGWWSAMLFGLLAYESYVLLQYENAGRGGWNRNQNWP
jgi:Zn-dependent protease